MQTKPIQGVVRNNVSFFPDDTIDVVRQHIAVAVNSHPDRLFIEVEVKLPKDYYKSNPMRWMELFYRLAYNRTRVSADAIEYYKTYVNVLPAIPVREYTELDWEEKIEELQPILERRDDFWEWFILGVDPEMSLVMPNSLIELPDYTGSPPLPKLQSLFETFHPYEVRGFRYVSIDDDDGPPEGIRRNYFPYFNPRRTPPNIGDLAPSLRQAREDLNALFGLLDRREAPKPKKHERVTILRAKWIVPLISTRFTAPRNRFEQIFYGLTVSKKTPYIGYFTSKAEVTRHKFYVEDPDNKVIDEKFKPMWRAWTNKTQPQRRLPTLLLYRGKSRTHFDRIAITPKDIIFSAERDKSSEETIEEIQDSLIKWFKTLDAVVPFVKEDDVDKSRWKLDMLNALATYSDSVRGFDPSRFGCLRNIFGVYKDSYRLLRAESSSDDISPLEIQAYQILNQDGVTPSADLLREELELPAEEAEALFSKIRSLGETFDIEKAAKAYPVIKFTGSEVIIKFVGNLERTLDYADILRFVLSLDRSQNIGICDPDVRADAPVVAVPQQAASEDEYDASNEDFLAGLDLDVPEPAPEPVEPGGAAAAREEPRERRIAVAQTASSTFNYFNTRLQKFDPRTFDSTYPGECERNRQVIVLDPEDQDRIRRDPRKGEIYTYSGRPDSEKLPLEDPEGLAICPPYWCIRDEIPLLPPTDPPEGGQLIEIDGELRCPVCRGKLRTSDRDDRTEFTVIERNTATRYPKLMKAVSETNKRAMPCCYKVPAKTRAKSNKGDDANYVLGLERSRIPAERFAYLDPELARRLRIETNYETTTKLGRLGVGNEDVFRIGLGRPSETLPKFLGGGEIPRPKDAADNVKKCSFFLSWDKPGKGDSQTAKIIDGIDQAYMAGDLDILKEVEYVASFLNTKVIRIDPKTYDVVCGFWTESVKAEHKTIVLVGSDILGYVSRRKGVKAHEIKFKVDIETFNPATKEILTSSHERACSAEVPTLGETKTDIDGNEYSYILDPLDRVQAIYVHGQAILPIRPVVVDLGKITDVQTMYYNELRDRELPEPAVARAFLESRRHDGFKVKEELYNSQGDLIEFLLNSGFRSPVKVTVKDPTQPAKEVVETVRTASEFTLLDGKPNKIDLQRAQIVTYEEEIYQFLIYSLSKDLVGEYGSLREAIELRSQPNIERQLAIWFTDRAYTSIAQPPVNFINKVRKPCGHFKDDPDGCKNSTLCGWVQRPGTEGMCKIKVRVQKDRIDATKLRSRMAHDLSRNDKLRNLVLDDRISPFFSTILYLELPHELITIDV